MDVEKQFKQAFAYDADSIVKESVLYSSLAKSKHLRYQLMMAVVSDLGLDSESAKDAALALEMIQTYSLIHDDLPAMDDDDMRRNQPSNHIKYGEATAILAGDGLLTKAFEHLAKSSYDDRIKVMLIAELAKASGISGMILGQVMDMNPSQIRSNNDVLKMYTLKTGMLFGAAMAMGAILADQGDLANQYRTIGQTLGVAFQVQDDLLECEKSSDDLGKSKSDAKNKKMTFVSLSGKEEAMYIQTNAFNDVYESLLRLGNHENVISLIKQIQNRGF